MRISRARHTHAETFNQPSTKYLLLSRVPSMAKAIETPKPAMLSAQMMVLGRVTEKVAVASSVAIPSASSYLEPFARTFFFLGLSSVARIMVADEMVERRMRPVPVAVVARERVSKPDIVQMSGLKVRRQNVRDLPSPGGGRD